MAKQASGACEVYCGDSMVLVNCTESRTIRDGIDYFPLLVDYEEKLYSVGRVPGSFGRREGKMPDKAILTSRLIDRPIRPLFPEGYRNDVQVTAIVMSADHDNPTDTLAMLGASVAIGLAGLPFNGPIGAVRIGRINGKFVGNPSYAQIEESDIDLVVAGTENSIMMVEAGCKLVTEKDILAAIDYAHTIIKKQVEVQRNFFRSLGIQQKSFEPAPKKAGLKELIVEHCTDKLKQSMSGVTEKHVRNGFLDEAKALLKEAIQQLPEEHELRGVGDRTIAEYMEEVEAEIMRAQVLDTGARADGRRCDDNRRMIGHGALAEKALFPIIPDKDKFPYTIRLVSEALASNGSTSMASTCGSSLALADAGVPIAHTVGGIAMGLILEGDKFAILSDIQGLEDFLGDMDFKVTGSRDGITALQMDIKIEGISLAIMHLALEQAKRGRLHIIDKMEAVMPRPRTEMSKWAPRILTLHINPEDIGTVIGPGGKMIRRIIEETGATIDIEDDGTVLVGSVDQAGGQAARDWIQRLVQRIEVNGVYEGRVTRIIPMGCFVEVLPGQEGMVHISQLENHRVEKVEDVVAVGKRVVVKVREIDDRNRVNLTMKGVTDEERAQFEPKPE
ncbi:MAG: polyribonucleotide nucleotidyltransferase [Candidatus Melainabacteria bacterium]|nr:polyribonucleotide nucleotidyltransferase [Candidatus Melainabacteria bacterium]